MVTMPGDLALTIVSAIDAAIAVVDRHGVLRFRNAAAESLFGHDVELESALSRYRRVGSDKGWMSLVEAALKSNASAMAIAAGNTGNSQIRFVVWAFSVGKEKVGEEQLVAIVFQECADSFATADESPGRLARLGSVTARVVHELNNPLDGILRYVNLAIRLLRDSDDPRLLDYLTESKNGLMRMTQIIGELLETSRRTRATFEESDINEVVEQAIRSFAVAAEQQRIVVAADFQTSDMPITSGSHLYQVCCNLIKNAIDAMPQGGRLTVTTGITEGDVVIRVADTGVGLPSEIDKIFEPFFTTKSAGKGTGLGLAICKDYVEGMGGKVIAAPGEEKGAVFTVRIPVGAFEVRKTTADAGESAKRRVGKAGRV